MKTWQAALLHLGATALQMTGAVAFFRPDTLGGSLANTGVQLAAQTGLTALQVWVASKNSKTDPKGNALVPVAKDQDGAVVYQTAPAAAAAAAR